MLLFSLPELGDHFLSPLFPREPCLGRRSEGLRRAAPAPGGRCLGGSAERLTPGQFVQRTLAALSTDAIGPALQMPTETPPLTKRRLGRDGAGEGGCAQSDAKAGVISGQIPRILILREYKEMC